MSTYQPNLIYLVAILKCKICTDVDLSCIFSIWNKLRNVENFLRQLTKGNIKLMKCNRLNIFSLYIQNIIRKIFWKIDKLSLYMKMTI